MTTTLIAGANRGLGLEFARQYLNEGDVVYAGCRHPDQAAELQAIGGERLRIVELDVASDESIEAAVRSIDGAVDRVINNAGIYGGDTPTQAPPTLDSQIAAEVYRVNVIGPMMILQAVEPKLTSQARVLNVSSGYGSIANSASGWPLHYCCSKAGLNMLSAIIGRSWAGTGRVVVAMSPGWVQTDMGGANADLTPEESVAGMRATLAELPASETGAFFDYTGQRKPW